MFELRYRMAGATRMTAMLTLATLSLLPATAGAAKPTAAPGKEAANRGQAKADAATATATVAQAPAGCAAATVIPSNPTLRKAAADAVLCLINVERTQRGLAPVLVSPLLTKAADSHASDMVRRGYFDHVTPSGVDLQQRVARTGYTRGVRRPTLGETIACGSDLYATPAELVKNLMQSAAHKAIITDRRYRDIGVGLALGAPLEGMGTDGATLSLDFGRR
jgi:uncharacterized protein YkwD